MTFETFDFGHGHSETERLILNLTPPPLSARDFIQRIESEIKTSGDRPVPDPIEHVAFEDVKFSYGSSETFLRDVSFEASTGDFVAFVGQSGTGNQPSSH